MVKHVNLHKRFPFLNSIISLVFGAVSSCLFQSVVDSWRNKGTIRQKLGAGVLFLVIIVVAFFYYRSFYADYIKKTTLEKETEKSEIQRIKKESELVASLYD